MGSEAQRIGDAMRAHAARAAKMLVLEIDKELRKGTPVDTGHARRNWVPSIGSPHGSETKDDSAHAAGIAEVLRYQLEQGPLWVANVVPYILRLNYGHSTQAPAGFVEIAVDRAMGTVKAKTGVDYQTAYREDAAQAGASNTASAYSPFGDD